MYRVLLIIFLLFLKFSIHAQQSYHKKLLLMGCRFEITIVEQDSVAASTYIEMAVSEISRIEKLISSWDAQSETSLINKNAGIKPIRVSLELFELIERSLLISKLTDGAFDISSASMHKLWKFDGSMQELPSDEKLKESVKKIGYENVILNKEHQSVFLKHKGMRIGFGAIGKGYAADRAKALLMEKGVVAGIINASGDMNTWGKQANGEDWKVAITNPMNKKEAFALLPISNGAVVSSGDYEKFIVFDGKRYSHIINPKTGYPATGIVSVTVFAQQAELADAFATSIFVMGTETGLNRVNQLSNVECIIIEDNGTIKTSENIRINGQ